MDPTPTPTTPPTDSQLLQMIADNTSATMGNIHDLTLYVLWAFPFTVGILIGMVAFYGFWKKVMNW